MNAEKNKYFNKVGGMALLDGVMMRSEKVIASATRKENNDIHVEKTYIEDDSKFKKIIKKIPVVRGVFAFINSLVTGINEITKSAGDEDDETLSNGEIFFAITFAIVLAITLFVLIPNFISNFIFPISKEENKMLYLLTEAAVKMLMFILYVCTISKMQEVGEVFKYHGAEHKAIACLEASKKLTVKNASKCSRFHARCGTSFICLVLLVSIFLGYFVNVTNVFARILIKICMLPLIAGISFEAIQLSNKYNNIFTRIIKMPGLWLQRITTKEPEEKHLECAIAALLASIEEEKYISVKKYVEEMQKEYNIERSDLLRLVAFVTNKDKNMLFVDAANIYLDYVEYINITNRVKQYCVENIPLQYILGVQEFFGMEFSVEKGVLIPRADTEVLVEKVIEKVNENGYKTVLDMCCGSGCIAISLAKNLDLEQVYAADISKVARKVTKKNAKKLGANICFVSTDLFKNITEKVDVIVSNPPYIESAVISSLAPCVQNEPHLALDGGESGLEFYEKITEKAREYLNDGGMLAYEIGYDQGDKVKNILKKYKEYSNIEVIKDLAGNERVVICHFHKI